MRVLLAGVASALILSVALLAAPALAGGELFKQAYLSTSVKKDGKPYDLYKDTRLKVDFDHENDGDIVRWDSGCNHFGAEVEVELDVIVTGAIDGTAMGCSPVDRRNRQDRFFARFFKADPAYVTSGNGLQLSARGVVIELQQRQKR